MYQFCFSVRSSQSTWSFAFDGFPHLGLSSNIQQNAVNSSRFEFRLAFRSQLFWRPNCQADSARQDSWLCAYLQ